MNKKTIGMLVCMLLIAAAVLPAVGIENVYKTKNVGTHNESDYTTKSNQGTPKPNPKPRPTILPPWFLKIFNGDWDYWSNPPHLFIIPEGNVGIGTSNPTSKLEVVGNVAINEGNVGIGTSNPISELEVNGRIEADGFTLNGIPIGTSNDSYWSAYEADLFYYGTVTIGALDNPFQREGDPPSSPPGLTVKGDILVNKSAHGKNGTGNITARGHIKSDGNISAKGHIKSEGNVTAKGHIKSEGNVTAKGHIKSDGDVTAKGHIKSDGDVTAKGHMKSEGNITAEKDLIVGRWIKFMPGSLGGIIFPDGSIQTKAATGAGGDDGDWIKTEDDMYANVSGNIGIGIENPDYKLTIIDQNQVWICIGNSQSNNFGILGWMPGGPYEGSLYLGTWGSNPIVLSPGEGSANVGIKTTNPTEDLDVDGTVRIRQMDTGNGQTVKITAEGVLKKEGSSIRYKEDIKDLNVNLLDILKLRPVIFKWKETGQEDIGLIAEEVDEVIPDLVLYDEKGRPDAVKYDKVPLYLLKIIQQQLEKINDQQEQIDKLKDEINNQQKQIDYLISEFDTIKKSLNIYE